LRLWNDQKSRSTIIQTLVLIGLVAFVFYIIGNAIANLEALGKSFGFDFLKTESNYDINQTLIEYDSRSSHLRATFVGILNTLLVAVCGIVLATVLGFILGVLRLSSNWLGNRISYCYVEFVRNVPLLVHILLIHGIVINTLPHPRKAFNFEGTFLEDLFFLSNRGFYVPAPVTQPLFWLVIAALVAGVLMAWWYARQAKAKQAATGQQSPVLLASIAAIIGLPLLVFFVTGMPFVRAGIESVNKGQTEAAHALGLNPNRTLSLVIIPQALRVIVPPLTSQYLNLTKNSSLAIAIGYMDIVATIGGISLNQTGREMECMLIVLGLYLTFSLLISAFMNWYNKRIALVER
jgi:general L-amino acid transport system permease protein